MLGTALAMMMAAANTVAVEEPTGTPTCFECRMGEPSDPLLAALEEGLEGALEPAADNGAAGPQVVSLTTDVFVVAPGAGLQPLGKSLASDFPAAGSALETPWDLWENRPSVEEDRDLREGPW